MFDITSQTANSASMAGVDGSSRICRVGEVQVQDSFTPSLANTVPSPAQMRALRSEVGGSANTEQGKPIATLRFHTSMWDALGAKPSAPVIEPPLAKTTPAPSLVNTASTNPRGTFSPDLWYAQAASHELHQKKEQLSYRPLRPASLDTGPDLREVLARNSS
jgi:hypothetical protein